MRLYDRGDRYRFERYFRRDPGEERLYGVRTALPSKLYLLKLAVRTEVQRFIYDPASFPGEPAAQ